MNESKHSNSRIRLQKKEKRKTVISILKLLLTVIGEKDFEHVITLTVTIESFVYIFIYSLFKYFRQI